REHIAGEWSARRRRQIEPRLHAGSEGRDGAGGDEQDGQGERTAAVRQAHAASSGTALLLRENWWWERRARQRRERATLSSPSHGCQWPVDAVPGCSDRLTFARGCRRSSL